MSNFVQGNKAGRFFIYGNIQGAALGASLPQIHALVIKGNKSGRFFVNAGVYGTALSITISKGGVASPLSGAAKGLSITGAQARLLGKGSLAAKALSISEQRATIFAPGSIAGRAESITLERAAILAVGDLAALCESISSAAAALSGSITPPPGITTIFIVSARQPTTRRQDYAGGKFWQRRVSAHEQTVRMP
jgi:hypothetical protein